jgi:aminomethyltransferase
MRDLTHTVGKMDLQGPESARILLKVLRNAEDTLKDMPYFSFKGHFDGDSFRADTFLHDGTPILLSRSGYTGEFGFELIMASEHVVPTWEKLLAAGEEFGILPCGLAARDSLRTGAGLPLSHQDIGPWPFINHPWPFVLPYTHDRTAFTKAFVGDAVLGIRAEAPHTYAFVGFDPRKVSIHEETLVADDAGNAIGTVLTCVTDMAIGWHEGRIYSVASPSRPEDFKARGLSCGFIKVEVELPIGREVRLRDGKRDIRVVVVDEIRPDRTARRPMREMLREKGEKS